MINLKLYSLADKRPVHNSTVLLFLQDHNFNPFVTDIIYLWEQFDNDQYSTGNYKTYDPTDSEDLMLLDNYRLVISDSIQYSNLTNTNCFWIPTAEYYQSFENE